MRVLMLGGTSLTGPYAVRRLHALGHPALSFLSACARLCCRRKWAYFNTISRTTLPKAT